MDTPGRVLVLATLTSLACSDVGRPENLVLSRLAPDDIVLPQARVAAVAALTAAGDTLPPLDIRFRIADSTIATVDSTGRITASGGAGTTEVVATARGQVATARVTVVSVLSRMMVEPETVVIRMGRNAQIRVWGLDLAGDTLALAPTFATANGGVAWINGDGTFETRRPGTTAFTVRADAPTGRRLFRAVPVTVQLDSAVVAHVPLPGDPWDVVAGPDGAVYVSLPGVGDVVRMDPAGYQITHRSRLGSRPGALAIDAAGSTLYVSVFWDRAIVLLDPATLTERSRLSIPGRPVSFAVDEPRGALHVATIEGWVYRVTLSSGVLADSVAGGGTPVVLSGDGTTIFVTTFTYLPRVVDDTLLAFDAANYATRRAFPTVQQPAGLGAPHAGSVAVTGFNGGIHVFDLQTGERRARFLPGEICGLAFSLDDTNLYAAATNGSVQVLAFPERTTRRIIELGGEACRIAVDPRTGRVLVPNRSPAWLDVIQP